MTCISGAIQRLINEGVVVLYHDYRSGTFLDWSGNGNDGIPTAPTELNGAGMRLNLTGRLEVAADVSLDLSGASASIIVFFSDSFFENPAGINYPFTSAGATGGVNLMCTDKRAYFQVGSSTSFNADPFRGKKYLGVSWIPGGAPDFFYDAVKAEPGATVVPAGVATSRTVYIGHTSGGFRQIPTTIGAVLATSRALTAEEHYQVYKDLSR